MILPFINRFTCNKAQLPLMIKNIQSKNMNVILDYTNEKIENHKQNYEEIMDLIKNHPNQHVALKLSSLNVVQPSVMEGYLENITEAALKQNCKLLIDAENYEIQDQIDKTTNLFMQQYNKKEVQIYKTYQMYRNDYFPILSNDLQQNRDFFIGVKLVRGAYYNEDKPKQILFDTIEETHDNYNNGIQEFVKYHKENDKLFCATHNMQSIYFAKKYIQHHKLKNIEFAQLLGMSDKMSSSLAKTHHVYKYLPYGDFHDTLPYLIRRLYENYPMMLNLFK